MGTDNKNQIFLNFSAHALKEGESEKFIKIDPQIF